VEAVLLVRGGEQLENSLTPRIIRLFEESEDASHDSRKLAERDRDYYDGKQLTSTEEAALKLAGSLRSSTTASSAR
jgi:hypothetical protein